MSKSSLSDIDYDDGVVVYIILGIVWLAFSFEAALIVGLAWLISGVSKQNAWLESELSEQDR